MARRKSPPDLNAFGTRPPAPATAPVDGYEVLPNHVLLARMRDATQQYVGIRHQNDRLVAVLRQYGQGLTDGGAAALAVLAELELYTPPKLYPREEHHEPEPEPEREPAPAKGFVLAEFLA